MIWSAAAYIKRVLLLFGPYLIARPSYASLVPLHYFVHFLVAAAALRPSRGLRASYATTLVFWPSAPTCPSFSSAPRGTEAFFFSSFTLSVSFCS
jgi:hypothetical protein